MKKITIILAILISILAVSFAGISFFTTNEVAIKDEETQKTIEMISSYNGEFYKSKLSDEKDIELYEQIEEALLYQVKNYKINFIEVETINKIAVYVFLDNPFFSMNNSYYSIEEPDGLGYSLFKTIKLPYNMQGDLFYARAKEALVKAEEIAKNTLEMKTDYDKAKFIHDYLITNVQYDNDEASESANEIYGALNENKSRCEGLTNAYTLLLNLAGIESTAVHYFAEDIDQEAVEGHMWNLIKLDGEYFYSDTTYDNLQTTDKKLNNKVTYHYFMLSTEEVLNYATFNSYIERLLPNIEFSKNEYFTRNNLVIKSYNREKVGKLIGLKLKEQKKSKINGVSIKFEKKADFNKALKAKEFGYLLSIVSEYDTYNSSKFTYIQDASRLIVTVCVE